MKKFKIILLVAAIATLFVSCDKPAPSPSDDGSFSVSPTSLTFTSDVSTQTLTITAGGKWYLDSSASWCQTSCTSGNGNGSVNVTVSANPNDAKREAKITFYTTGNKLAETVTVTQTTESAPAIVVNPEPWDGKKRADISYQLLIYSFADSNGDGIGDFKGIEAKLDYLDELGVNAIWLSPAHPATSYHGYDVLDYEAINSSYGTEADFKSLIDAAHSHGIKIYMDYVINHTSKDHPWFKAAIADENSEYRDYYVLSEDPASDIAAGKIPQISTEGKSGYDSGQWFSAVSSGITSQKIKFTLKWGTTPTLTAEQVETVSNSGNKASDKYLYYGDGNCVPFYTTGTDNVYTLSVDISSSWGVLVRTSNTTWDGGTKYGAPSTNHQLVWGEPLKLSNTDAQDILLPGMKSLMYHSHFWTSYFADLNYGYADQCADSPAFKAIVKAAEKWIDLGVDGFRLDGAKHVYHNASSTENPTFWNTFFTTLNEYYHKTHSEDIYMVGEVYDDYSAAAPYYKGFPAIFEFAFWYRLEYALNHKTGRYFAKDIISYQPIYESYRKDYIEATKLSNHDEDRTGSTLNGNVDMMKMAGAILLTAGGHPYEYYGEELGYVGKKENGDEYVRSPLKWGDSYTTTYIKQIYSGMADVKDVATQSADENSILSTYRRLGQLRNTYPALATGKMSEHTVYNSGNDQANQIAAWYMTEGSQKILVVHNVSNTSSTVNLSDNINKAIGIVGTVAETKTDSNLAVKLGAYSSVIYLLK